LSTGVSHFRWFSLGYAVSYAVKFIGKQLLSIRFMSRPIRISLNDISMSSGFKWQAVNCLECFDAF